MGTNKKKKNEIRKIKQGIKVSKNGPYLITGSVPMVSLTIVTDAIGDPTKWNVTKEYPMLENYSLCRCGKSKTKPFCDGTHAKINFDGTETASREPYLKLAKIYEGPGLTLADNEDLCARVRFCHREGGIWNLVRNSENSVEKALAIEEAACCASGRLTLIDKKTGAPIEPKFDPSIALVEGPKAGTMGPIWVRGGIPIESADGKPYEIRNRVTLCRCGKSSNKPFCDGRHAFELA